ncbi:MAG: glutamine amidotransferase [Euryarchaeota archaeon]|jgi:CobQ-like glutamine amidotransferase family enzyme|uniref:type 1 glutamine amidotransferase n=1 Tax=Methanobacterium sp. MZD130B TaxID=3394378 RepID=UPI001764173B|nr:glutamine amidotransferase [Euryarchaeota archaeon]HHT18583.1 glutamine amidotransferase [Methanobacterium sp.]
MELKIYHMYPDLLNLYGDIGNVTCLTQRCKWRGIQVEVVGFSMKHEAPLIDGDLFFIGGGSDRGQNIVYTHLRKYSNQIGELIEEGTPVLAICGGYQLLGEKYIDAEGSDVPGLGIFDYYTRSEEGRLIGNIIIENSLGLNPETFVGFENHGGRTYHEHQPLGKVLVGYGNNGKDKQEGMVYRNCIGTYLHGPLLPKNPQLADFLILKALERKYGLKKLPGLEDDWEYAAHNKVLKLYSP